MVTETNELLKKICWKLSSGDVSNYLVDIEIFESNRINDNEVQSIKNILGVNVVEVGEIEKSDLYELLKIIKECFEFSGDESAYPNKYYLFSTEFESDTRQILEQIKLIFSDNSEIYKFWLKNGHPFYPVFWDCSFLVRKDQSDFVFIGSSSD